MRVNILPSKLKDSIGEKDTFKILILSDLHIPIDMELKEVITYSEILKDIDHVILLGDNVACYGNDEEYRFLNEFILKLSKPYSVINGNHEFMFRSYAYGTKEYGKVWEKNEEEGRKEQLEKFRRFFSLKEFYWEEEIEGILYLFLCIGEASWNKIEVLPRGGEEFLQNKLKEALLEKKKGCLIFCHAPLSRCKIHGFKYYTDKGDPFVYLQNDTFTLIDEFSRDVYWISGHLHLMTGHPMAFIRKITKNLYQINCPPSWLWGRKTLEDIVPKRYEEFNSVILECKNKKLVLKLYDWLKKDFINTCELF